MSIPFNTQTSKKLETFLSEHPHFKKNNFIALALNLTIDYHNRYGNLPCISQDIIPLPSPELTELVNQACDLPGMSQSVIQSHLIRFPRVTPQRYAKIIDQLHTMQQSEGGLKNAESVAYGLAKRANNCREATEEKPSKPAPPEIPLEDLYP